ncbi:MAG TPA: hypothetical protein VGL36_35580 [Kribbella sp.]
MILKHTEDTGSTAPTHLQAEFADRYDGQICTAVLTDGATVTGRTYAYPGWTDPNAMATGLRITEGRNEHWISASKVRDVQIIDATGVLTVGQQVQLVDNYGWYGGLYRGAAVEITQIGHGSFSQPFNTLYIVKPLAPAALHANITVGPQDIAGTAWFVDGELIDRLPPR